ncbi:GspE/PulE family protein [Eubacterium pyruvativorans]|uniref:GspE/PulE family protein n=1 Tax=Eubacterium pyruvativorans TaxID=155865 RepID=UPI0015689D91|nr:GspE/PulE family protein [Eubacterium pyruvativorans]
MKNKRLGEMLVSMGQLTEEQLKEALDLQKKQKGRFGEILIDNGFITEEQLIETLRIQLGIDFVDLTKTEIDPAMSKYVPKAMAKEYLIIPVRVSNDNLFLAMEDPLNFLAQEEAAHTSKKKIVPMIASRSAIEHAISTLYGNEGAVEAMAQMRAEAGFREEEVTPAEENSESNAPTIRLVNSIIERAHNENASDIHFEPTDQEMVIRMRIDGRLHKVLTIPKELRDSVISRIKIMGRMDTVERRIPQDGRASVKLNGDTVDMRLSTLPTMHGEKAVIRILGGQAAMLDRKAIGIPESENRKLDRLTSLTSGVILIVGPTGSGKSSTMYTLVNELLSEETNLITLEDPVEYNIRGASQVQINEKVGLTFASGLRAILRQDPDIVCVGEIRDGETAEIAMRAAMTGHLVITTIHTEDAISAIDRLKDMGVEPYMIASAVRGIISQRLVRKICWNCRTEYTPEPGELESARLKPYPGRKFYIGKGCEYCFHTGYRGRIGVFEILMMNDELRRLIVSGGTKQAFREASAKTDFVPMIQNADRLVQSGITSISEVIRMISNLE